MNENTSRDELIEQYLLGTLSGDLLHEFNEMLAADAKFKREVDLQRDIIRHIKLAGRNDWKRKLEGFHQGMNPGSSEEEHTGKVTPFKKFYHWKYITGVAAAVVFVILCTTALINNSGSSTDRIFAAYYKPYVSIEQNTRTLPEAASTERSEAFKAYDKGDYARSISLFKKVLDKGNDEVVLFYLGNAYLSDNNAKEAEQVFKTYLKHYQEFALESAWYLSLSYIRQGKTGEAKPLLDELSKGNSSYRKEADEIRQKL